MTAHSGDSVAWTQTPERGNMLLMRIMVWLSLFLGRRVSRVVLHGIAVYFVLFFSPGRLASRSYLTRVLGRTATWRDSYRQFFSFASITHDRIYFIKRQLKLFSVTIHGDGLLTPLLAAGNGLFLIGAHMGSFEALRAMASSHSKLRAVMVMHEENALKINSLLRSIDAQVAHDIIPLGHPDSMIKVANRLAEGCAIGILADRTPIADTMQPVQLLGAQALLPTGPFRMAALLKQPVIFMTGLYLGGNQYAIHFETLADFTHTQRSQRAAAIETAVHRYAALLEQYCRKAPYNWFNFFDFWQAAPAAPHSKIT